MSHLKLVLPDTDQSIVAQAVTKLWNDNIKLIMWSENDRNTLLQSPLIWVSHLSSKLEVACLSYKVIVHRVPTTYNPDNSNSLLNAIEKENLFIVEFTISWISHQPYTKVTTAKMHSSVVLDCNDPTTANEALQYQIAFNSHLLCTEKYHPPLIQCFNCHCFGHFACQC